MAILEPSLVYALPLAGGKAVRWERETAAWLANARQKGADAVYARLHGGAREEVAVVEWLVKEAGMEVLAPGWMAGECAGKCGLHFRGDGGEGLVEAKGNAGAGQWMGQSCHSLEEVVAAERRGADYIFISPIFPTLTHPEARPLGLEALAEVCEAVNIPVFALGGINETNAPTVLKAGASGIAAIRMFLG